MKNDQTPISKQAVRSAIKIVVTYAVIASIWIIFSDLLLEQLPIISDHIIFQILKGLGFVIITAGVLFGLLFKYFHRFIAYENELHRQEKKLQESETLYRNLVENSSDLIWSIDTEWRITFINEASHEIYGREPDEMIGRLYTDFIPPEQIELNTASWEEALDKNDRISGFENWVQHKDGHRVLLSANAILLRDSHGEVIGSAGISRDITQQKANEKQIRLQANLLRAVQQAVIATDLDGKIIYWNRYAQQVYGWTQEEVLGRDIIEITVPRLSEKQADKIMEHLKQQGEWSGEFTVARKDGSEFLALVSNSLYYDDHHEPAGIIGLSIDISDRKETENQLKIANNYLRAIFEASPAAIIVFDDEGYIKDWNPIAEHIFGWQKEEVIGQKIPIIPDDKWDEFDQKLAELRHIGGQSDLQVQRIRKDGTLRDFSLYTARFEGPDDTTYYMALYIDITNRLNVRKQLENTNSLLKQTFASLTEAVFVIDSTDRTVITCNAAVEQILGYTPDEVIGKRTEFLHVDAESHRNFALIGDKILEKEGCFSTEYQMRHKNGQIIDTDHTVALLHPESGPQDGAVSVIRDITQQKKTRLQLENSEARYRQLFENSPVMILEQDFSELKQYLEKLSESLADTDDLRTYLQTHPEAVEKALSLVSTWDINQICIKMYGAQSKQHFITEMNQIIQPESEAMRHVKINSLLAIHTNQPIFEGEFTNKTLQGNWIELLIRWIALPGYETTYERVLVTGIDITERKQIENDLRIALERERKLKSQANKLRLIAESLVLATEIKPSLYTSVEHLEDIVEYDTIILMSIEGEQLVPIIYRGIRDSTAKEQQRNYTTSNVLLDSLTKGHTLWSASTKEDTVIRQLLSVPDSARSWVAVPLISRGINMGLVSLSRLNHEFKEEDIQLVESFSYQISSALDNSRVHQDLKNSYQQLKQAQEKAIQTARLSAIGELAAGVAHQINNPLMTVIADSHLILKNVESGSLLHESAKAISRAAYKAGTIVERLLDFAKATPSDMKEVDINDSLQQAINLIRPQIEPRYAELQIHFSDKLPTFYGSDDHLQDVWMNLLINARDAVENLENGLITITTEFVKHEHMIRVMIEDNGLGIDNEQIDQIFDPFYTTKEHGTGLGLSICADIIRKHKGTIHVESQPEEGTKFIINFLLDTLHH